MVDLSLGEHSVVLELSSSDGGAVVGNEDEFGLSLSQGLNGRFISFTQVIRLPVSKDISHLPSLYFPDLMTRPSF